MIDEVAIPLAFRRIEAAELVDWDGDTSEPEFQGMLAAITALVGQEAAPRRKQTVPRPAARRVSRRGRDRGGRKFPMVGILTGAIVGLVVVVVVLVINAMGSKNDAQEPVRTPSQPAPARPAPVNTAPAQRTVSVTLRYMGDLYGCMLNLDIAIGNRQFRPSGSIYQVSGLTPGSSTYRVSGVINCPTIGSCNATGSGPINVQAGAVYDVGWTNAGLGRCMVTLDNLAGVLDDY